MASATTRKGGGVTYDFFSALLNEYEKADLIEGVMYVASPENTDANRLFRWLFIVFSLYASKRKLGEVFGSRVACRLDESNGPEPDLLFVKSKHLNRIQRGGINGPPDLALEIVSPDSVERDYTQKRKQYQKFKVPEYWIVDEEQQEVSLLQLDSKGKYREVKPRKGILYSQELTGFWLDPGWLWQHPFPDELDILMQLLAEQP